MIKPKNPNYQKSGNEVQLFNPQRKILTRFVSLYLADVEKKPFMILSFERVFQLTPPSEDLPNDLAAVGYIWSQSDGRRKRLLV